VYISSTLSSSSNYNNSNNEKPIKKRKHKKHNFLWCHQCKQKHETIYYCSKYESGSCSKKYCKGCIERHYNESVANVGKNWECMYCRNICICAFCRRKRGEEQPKKGSKRGRNNTDDIPVQTKKLKKEQESFDRISCSPTPTDNNDNNMVSTRPPSPLKYSSPSNSNDKANILLEKSSILPRFLSSRIISIGDTLKITGTSYQADVVPEGLFVMQRTIVHYLEDFFSYCGISFQNEDDMLEKVICNGVSLKMLKDQYLRYDIQDISLAWNDRPAQLLLYEHKEEGVPYWLTVEYPLYSIVDSESFIKRYLSMNL